MATPRQIATLLGLCAVSFGLFYASTLAEDQPIVLWGESAETTMAQKPDASEPAAGAPADAAGKPADHEAAKQTKPAPAAAKPAAKASAAPAATASAAPVKAAAKPETKASPAPVKAAAKPETTASAAPAKTAAKPETKASPAPVKTAAKPAAAPAATPAPAKPAAMATKPSAAPTGPVNAVPLNPKGGRIPASTPERLAAMAKQSAGRVDPFVSLELPAATLSAAPAVTTRIPTPPGKVSLPKPTATPLPTPGDGMVVTGIITSAKESVAIVAADGRSRLVQVGDFLPGGIRVVSINPQGKAVIVSHGGRSARLAVKE